MREELKNCKKIVVKIGTSSLTHSNGNINLRKMEKLALVLTDLKQQGKEVILVSSGAIGVGAKRINLKERPQSLELKQATAAIGQAILMQIYEKFFGEYNQVIAQVLLTKDVIENSIKNQNAKNTFEKLLELSVIPIVNENDCISTDQIEGCRFGDNDTLSALVAKLVDADILILLTDIDGLYTDNPQTNPKAEFISEVHEITDEIKKLGKDSNSEFGTGGMATKITAAQIAKTSKTHTVVALGDNINNIYDILEGKEVGTWFIAK
ncbi:MAG: glutamate 5-kinase [Cellulosilyticaceae bacterium]